MLIYFPYCWSSLFFIVNFFGYKHTPSVLNTWVKIYDEMFSNVGKPLSSSFVWCEFVFHLKRSQWFLFVCQIHLTTNITQCIYFFVDLSMNNRNKWRLQNHCEYCKYLKYSTSQIFFCQNDWIDD